jgi:hypothetical protein
MPTEKVKAGIYVTAQLWQRFQELARRNRRNASAELEIAMEQHLAQATEPVRAVREAENSTPE